MCVYCTCLSCNRLFVRVCVRLLCVCDCGYVASTANYPPGVHGPTKRAANEEKRYKYIINLKNCHKFHKWSLLVQWERY